MGFENPSRNKANLWVEEETRRAVSEDSRMYEDKKFETSNVLDVIGGKNPLDPGEIISDNEVRYISSDENRFPDVESFTAEGVLRKEIEESEVTKLGWGFEQLPSNELVPGSGKVTVEARSTRGDDAYQLWIPFVDASDGVVAGFVEPPYDTPETFAHSLAEEPSSDAEFFEKDVLDIAYMAAQELVPEVEPDYTGRYDKDWFKSKLYSTGIISPLRELESEGEVRIGDQTHIGTARGGGATGEVQEFANRARERRIIDYRIENDNKDNLIRIEGEPYKTITQDAEHLDRYDGPIDVIEQRLTQG